MRYYNDYLQTDDTLAHYGVLGMKWGVRHDKERANSKRNQMQIRSLEKKISKTSKNKSYRKSFNYKRHMRASEAAQQKYEKRKRKYKEAVEKNTGKYFEKVSRQKAITGSVLSLGAASGLAYSALNDLNTGNATGAVLKAYGAYSLAGLSGGMLGMEVYRPKN